MEVKQLRIFLRVSRLGSFTKAAKELNYSQSTISENIINLEKELGIKLFDRINKKVSLTTKGEGLLEYANRIVDLCDEAKDVISDVDEASGTITIGITESLCSYKFPDFFKSYLSDYKKVNLCFKIGRCEELISMIQSKKIDIAFTLDAYMEIENVDTINLFEEEIVFITSVDSEISKKEKVSYKDFDKEKIVLSQGLTGYNIIMSELYKRENIEEGSILYLESLEGIKAYVKRGFGISFIPRVVIEKELINKELSVLNVNSERFYHIVKILVHKNKYQDKALKTLIDRAIDSYSRI